MDKIELPPDKIYSLNVFFSREKIPFLYNINEELISNYGTDWPEYQRTFNPHIEIGGVFATDKQRGRILDAVERFCSDVRPFDIKFNKFINGHNYIMLDFDAESNNFFYELRENFIEEVFPLSDVEIPTIHKEKLHERTPEEIHRIRTTGGYREHLPHISILKLKDDDVRNRIISELSDVDLSSLSLRVSKFKLSTQGNDPSEPFPFIGIYKLG